MTASEQYVTDGGLETDLIYNRGFDLPDFAAFPLLEGKRGRRVLRSTTRSTPPSRRRPVWAAAGVPDLAGEQRLGRASGTTPTHWRP